MESTVRARTIEPTPSPAPVRRVSRLRGARRTALALFATLSLILVGGCSSNGNDDSGGGQDTEQVDSGGGGHHRGEHHRGEDKEQVDDSGEVGGESDVYGRDNHPGGDEGPDDVNDADGQSKDGEENVEN